MKLLQVHLLALALAAALAAGCNGDPATQDANSTETTTTASKAAAWESDTVLEEPDADNRAAVPTRSPVVNRDSGLSFTDLDKDMDGGIARHELPDTEMLHQHFFDADGSRDGKLSYKEVERHRLDMRSADQGVVTDGRTIVQMDRDGDGGVAVDELWENEMLRRHFDEADADMDTKLSAEEIDKHRRAMATGE